MRSNGQDEQEIGYTDSLLSSSIGGRFYMGIARYAPGAERPEEPLLAHGGEEHGLLVEGELEMQIGEELITLRAGDSYSFDARIPHHGRNRAEAPAVLVWAVSPVVIPKDIHAAAAIHRGGAKKKTIRLEQRCWALPLTV